MTPLLQVQDLAYQTPDKRPLIQQLNFALALGEIVTITGPNGIGKSTLLRLLLGESAPTAGSVLWHLPMNRVGFLSQLHNREFHISLTLADILNFTGKLQRNRIEEQSYGLLRADQLGLAWNTASGGERQKTLLTRIFLDDPIVLLLDEPMNHLDVASRQQLRAALRQFIADGKHAVLMVGHELSLALSEWSPNQTINLKGNIVQ